MSSDFVNLKSIANVPLFGFGYARTYFSLACNATPETTTVLVSVAVSTPHALVAIIVTV